MKNGGPTGVAVSFLRGGLLRDQNLGRLYHDLDFVAGFEPRVSTEDRVIAATTVAGSISTTTSAMMLPSLVDTTVPGSWLRALSSMRRTVGSARRRTCRGR